MDGVPITNTLFPPPPGYYKAFTPEALAKVAATADEVEGSDGRADAQDDPELELLRPPRSDWVLEDGRWMLFGTMYTAEPHIASAAEIGLPQPIVAAAEKGREGLPILLHSFLHTLLAFIDALTTTARSPDELDFAQRASEGDQYIQHLSNLAASMMVSANQLRGVQAEATLVMVMERQVEERRRQTEALRAKSREVASTIRRLKEAAGAAQKTPDGQSKDAREQSLPTQATADVAQSPAEGAADTQTLDREELVEAPTSAPDPVVQSEPLGTEPSASELQPGDDVGSKPAEDGQQIGGAGSPPIASPAAEEPQSGLAGAGAQGTEEAAAVVGEPAVQDDGAQTLVQGDDDIQMAG